MWLLAIFIAIPLIEIALFIQVGGWLTLWPTLAIVIATAMLGTALVQRQGRKALNDLRRAVNDLRDPSDPLGHGVMIVLAGILLLTPGFLTDGLGFLLLIPKVRDLVIATVRRNVSITTVAGFSTTGGTNRGPDTPGDVIEGEYRPLKDPENPSTGPSGRTQD